MVGDAPVVERIFPFVTRNNFISVQIFFETGIFDKTVNMCELFIASQDKNRLVTGLVKRADN